uniref:3-beta hydroxysteroid dehydrogenase/isomerase domain-containing protein n=1 Tax=Chromera velia CCMP2878 TaxID=1169474 RepID=A0A0G4HZD4_9ALVE|mmetsp:Transcript_34858/g.68822  ORF Transcript_34858/g.68822 Transcript_34858/m.68822 type:complete len:383 (+) Transcript_34858:91-1239(+)|eukprot:Cvel_9669.t1-p1 / transcript=Cvel_9669.t1 / gene=Cvel_9669 / organism=Chromera_velia_CCMP2878 / gene_product=Sterol-4-alpha-carboxylate 3-dehydrogenase,, putative / transcript_product=Sterol-4-alpha-carboxylate 3-dehydrogenase,, putative / location=Cvel_scaffold563:35220-36365(-) / protein_length=382 / sequence_SO=supercontig / SO=protein_coding / is_pseudo=false
MLNRMYHLLRTRSFFLSVSVSFLVILSSLCPSVWCSKQPEIDSKMSVSIGKAFVTGGSGFVGQSLIQQLKKEGSKVVALARSETAASKCKAAGADEVILADVNSLSEDHAVQLQGCDVAFHLAAKVAIDGPLSEHMKDSFDGLVNVATRCRDAGVPSFVFCSSEQAVLRKHGWGDAKFDEASLPPPENPQKESLGPYATCKALCERWCRQNNSPSFRTVIIRPRLIWGKGDTVVGTALQEAVDSGQMKWIGGGKALTSTTHVRNVVEGLLCGARKGVGGEAYYVVDPNEPLEVKAFFSEYVPALTGKTSIRKIGGAPFWAARILGWVGLIPSASPYVLFTPCQIDDSKARRDLGYVGHVSREEGMRELEHFEETKEERAPGS